MKTKHRGQTYQYLLKDDDVRRWFENVSRGSEIWADVCLRRIGKVCSDLHITPKDMLKFKEKELYDFLMDLVSDLEKKGYAGSYIASIMKALKSWLSFNGISLIRKIKIKDAQEAFTLRDERIPTNPELKRILLSANKSSRVIIAMMAFSGVRPQVIGNYLGTDGLTLGDFPEMEITDNGVEFMKMPTLIRVRRELSKSRRSYQTFLGEEGCEYVKDYLNKRTRDGERLDKSSSLVRPKVPRRPFISAVNIGDACRKAIRLAGFSWRPYVLRSYFDTQLMLAESKGVVLHDYRTFWMGHVGDIEHRYTINKGRLPPQVVEDMRNAYKRAQTFLETRESEQGEDSTLKMIKLLLKAGGHSDEEIEELSLKDRSEAEIIELLKPQNASEGNGNQQQAIVLNPQNGSNGKQQQVIPLRDLPAKLKEGWEFKATLPDGCVVIENLQRAGHTTS